MLGCERMRCCYSLCCHAGYKLSKKYMRKHCLYRENAHTFAVLWCSVEVKLSVSLAVGMMTQNWEERWIH